MMKCYSQAVGVSPHPFDTKALANSNSIAEQCVTANKYIQRRVTLESFEQYTSVTHTGH
jgi:hypothetical protein